jgi:DNA-binding MarR family transcriptional regulator
MDIESRRDLQLLDALEQDSALTQRTLAARLGVALGLINLYLKRLIRKGYIKCVSTSPNRLVYLVTPRGLARKARLTIAFMEYSLDLYRDARRHMRRNLDGRVGRQRRVAIYGTGEAAELAFLVLRELGLEPVAIFDSRSGGQFLGLPVRALDEQGEVEYDTLIVGTLDRAKKTAQELIRHGVKPERLLLLRADVAVPGLRPSRGAAGRGSVSPGGRAGT